MKEVAIEMSENLCLDYTKAASATPTATLLASCLACPECKHEHEHEHTTNQDPSNPQIHQTPLSSTIKLKSAFVFNFSKHRPLLNHILEITPQSHYPQAVIYLTLLYS